MSSDCGLCVLLLTLCSLLRIIVESGALIVLGSSLSRSLQS
jgi:hypothetical protein